MQKPDTEEIILKALYAEAIHHGDFNEVTAQRLDMESRDFGWALYVLQMRGLIEGCKFQPPHPSTPGAVMGVIRRNLTLTAKGFEQVENDMGVGNTGERLEGLWRFFRDIGVSVFAEQIWAWMQKI